MKIGIIFALATLLFKGVKIKFKEINKKFSASKNPKLEFIAWYALEAKKYSTYLSTLESCMKYFKF